MTGFKPNKTMYVINATVFVNIYFLLWF